MFRLPRPQKNYTEVPNVVFDLIMPKIDNLAPLKCYLTLIRKTWGWGKIGDWLSLSQLTHLTGLAKNSVIAGMVWLEGNGYIWIVKAGNPGKEKTMYFLCTDATEQLENSFKQGLISAGTIYATMIQEK